MARYRSIYRCRHCGHRWKTVTSKAPSVDDPCPPCPNLDCGEIQTRLGMDIASGVAPAQIGQNNSVKAIDETARIVMEDHHMTDLRSDVRETETMTPKLPPQQQQAADNFFGAPRQQQRRTIPMRSPLSNAVQGAVANALGGMARQELHGATTPIADIHRSRMAIPTRTINRSA